MRAYRKTTQHPFCLYLTAEEAAALVEEAFGVDPEYTPLWSQVADKVETLVADPDRERA